MSNENHRLRILNIVLLVIAVIAIAVGIVLATVSHDSAMNETLDSQNNEFVDGDDKNVDTETEDGSYGSESKSDDGTSGSNTDISGELVYTLKNGTYEVEYSGICTETSITIPSSYMGVSVTSIAAYAFNGCDTLVSISIPSEITSIGERAFYGCGSLDSITIPENVTSIGDYAFYGCVSLEDINFNATDVNDLSGSNYVFYNAGQNGDGITLSIGRDVTKIPAYLFCPTNNSSGVPKVVDVVFVDSSKCTSVGTYAFAYCKYLTSINLPDRIESIDAYAFSECEALISVVIPDRVTTVSTFLFYDCTSLKYLTIGEGITSIKSNAFEDCTALEEIYFNSASVSDLSSKNSVFENAGKNGNGITVTLGRNVIRIPAYLFNPYDSVSYAPNILEVTFTDGCLCSSIGSYAFYDCTSLNRINIPSGVTSIGEYAFYNCTSLESANIPNGLTSVKQYTFYNCTSLTSVTIPEGVSEIGSNAFDGCVALEEIIFNAVSMKDLESGNRVFYSAGQNCDGIVLIIGENVTKIPAYLFRPYYDSSAALKITNLIFEDGCQVTSISSDAFYELVELENLYYGIETLDDFSENGGVFQCAGQNGRGFTITIGSKVTKIPSYSFYSDGSSNDSKLLNVTFEDDSHCASIGDYAFYGCKNLATINIPDSVSSVGDYVFYNCASLQSVSIPDGAVTEINYIFYGCTSLKELTIGKSVTSISKGAFSGLSSLESVSIPFVGGGAGSSSASSSTLFGYIFGSDSYTGGVSTKQYYSSTGYSTYYIPASLTSVAVTGDKILYGAFYGCTSVESITISATSIGSYAFNGCTSLKSAIINPETTSIGSASFSGCSSLENITIPFIGGSTTRTYGSTFGYIFGSESYEGGELTTQYYTGSLYNTYYIPSKLNSVTVTSGDILYGAFEHCVHITSIILSEGITSIDGAAFYGCTALKSITIPSSLLSIGSFAFDECPALSDVYILDLSKWGTINFYGMSSNPLISGGNLYVNGELLTSIPNWMTSINDYMFCGWSCSSLVIPSSVTSIGSYAFAHCESLTSAIVPDSVISMGSYAFGYCSSLTSIELPSSLVSISDSMFYYCTSLVDIIIPDSVTSIGKNAFSGCSSLVSIIFSDNVKSIGDYAFQRCVSLETVIIGDGVTSIGKYSFSECSGMITLCIGESVVSVGNYAFYDCTSLENIFFDAISMDDLSTGNYVFFHAGRDGNRITLTVGAKVTKIPAYFFNPYSNYFVYISCIVFEDGCVCTSIGNSAFNYCLYLTKIYYKGGIDLLASMTIGSNNSYLTSSTKYYYSKDKPTDGGNYWYYDEYGKPVAW